MLILWAFFVFSQDPTKKIVPNFTPNPILRIIEKSPGSNRHEKALNFAEEVCQEVAAHVMSKGLVGTKDKELVKKELDTMAKVFALARKEMTEDNYSTTIGAMTRFMVIVVRNIPGQKYYGPPAREMREKLARVLDEMRPGVFIPEDLDGFIERAKGENVRVRTICGVGFFCQAIFQKVLEVEKLDNVNEAALTESWNRLVNLHNDRVVAKGALTLDQWKEIRENNFRFFYEIKLKARENNRHAQNYSDLHKACAQALDKIKP